MRQKDREIQDFYHQKLESKKLFSIGQMKQASGFSRSTLVKLEEAGYLKPRKVSKSSGYRYYDAFNLGELAQYQNLRQMGFSAKEIIGYTSGEITPDDMLAQIENRLQLLQRFADEFRMRLKKSNNYMFSIIHLSETTCYCRTMTASSPPEVAAFTFGVIHEAVFKGYRMLHGEPLFSIRHDTRTRPMGHEDAPYETTVCVPLDPYNLKEPLEEGIRVIPGADALSLLYYGSHEDTDSMNRAQRMMWEEMEQRGLSSDGSMRALGLVVPYYGMQIEPEDYVFRFAIPLT